MQVLTVETRGCFCLMAANMSDCLTSSKFYVKCRILLISAMRKCIHLISVSVAVEILFHLSSRAKTVPIINISVLVLRKRRRVKFKLAWLIYETVNTQIHEYKLKHKYMYIERKLIYL
jgi:hypothetical protein